MRWLCLKGRRRPLATFEAELAYWARKTLTHDEFVCLDAPPPGSLEPHGQDTALGRWFDDSGACDGRSLRDAVAGLARTTCMVDALDQCYPGLRRSLVHVLEFCAARGPFHGVLGEGAGAAVACMVACERRVPCVMLVGPEIPGLVCEALSLLVSGEPCDGLPRGLAPGLAHGLTLPAPKTALHRPPAVRRCGSEADLRLSPRAARTSCTAGADAEESLRPWQAPAVCTVLLRHSDPLHVHTCAERDVVRAMPQTLVQRLYHGESERVPQYELAPELRFLHVLHAHVLARGWSGRDLMRQAEALRVLFEVPTHKDEPVVCLACAASYRRETAGVACEVCRARAVLPGVHTPAFVFEKAALFLDSSLVVLEC